MVVDLVASWEGAKDSTHSGLAGAGVFMAGSTDQIVAAL